MRRPLKVLACAMAVLAGLAFGGCASQGRNGLDGNTYLNRNDKMDPASNF